jgi:hypothetical protein
MHVHFYLRSEAKDQSAAFIAGLKEFLKHNPLMRNDVHFSSDNSTVLASRCYVLTKVEVNNAYRKVYLGISKALPSLAGRF